MRTTWSVAWLLVGALSMSPIGPSPAAAQSGESVGGSAGRFVFGIGAGYSNLPGREPIREEGFTTTAVELGTSGYDLSLSGEVRLLPFLTVGAGFERVAASSLAQDFELDGFRDFTARVRGGVFDPLLVEAYVMPSLPLHRRVRVFGTLGIGHWRADTEATVVLLFDGDVLEFAEISQRNDGIAGVYGAGIDVWPHRRVGLRVGYRFLQLRDGDAVDEPLHNLRFLALLPF